MIESFETFDEAYRSSIAEIRQHGRVISGVNSSRSIGSGFGKAPRPFTEVLGGGFQLLNPRARILKCSPRKLDVRFAYANFLFTLGGGQDLEMITHYNARGEKFFESDNRYETAFGCRLFSPGHQIAYVKEKLVNDRESRRAVAQIYEPVDTLLDRRDTPCAISLQFLIREERLHCICFMRSQSAVMVMPYDVFLFTMIQEWLATDMHLELGTYTHQCGSLHFYDDDDSLIEPILRDMAASDEMPRMLSSGVDVQRGLCGQERALRSKGVGGGLHLDSYWLDFLAVVAP
jgi:thymidylate synthase